jgi:hypothetical protein
LIQTDGGGLLLVEGEEKLAQLLGSGEVTGTAAVYEVGAGPRALAEIPGMARVMSAVVPSGTPRRPVRRSERDLLSEELKVLDRPIDYEIEYYDEKPPRRWPKRVALTMGLLAAAAGAYFFVPRVPQLQSLAIARLIRPAPPPPAVAAALPEPSPAPVAPPVAAAPPPPVAPAPPSESPPAADEPPPVAEAEEKPTHSPKRHHSSRHHSSRR